MFVQKKKNTPRQSHAVFLKSKLAKQKSVSPLPSVSWRRADISSCLLQLSRLSFGSGHSVSKCVFCVWWVQGFGTCSDCQQGDSHPSQCAHLQEVAWWLPAGSAEHVQPQPGVCRLTTPPTAGWPLNKTHMVLAQGYLLHASKYLQAQAPDGLNALCQFPSLCSRTHSQGVVPSPLLSPLAVPAGSGVFLKQH